jgi:hypothetical protein
METIYGPDWGTTLALSFAITWAIGLTPPILLRFVFLSRPIGMWPAIGVVAGFAFFNLMLFVALGSQSKSHTVVVLIAFVSFYILRKGGSVEVQPDEVASVQIQPEISSRTPEDAPLSFETNEQGETQPKTPTNSNSLQPPVDSPQPHATAALPSRYADTLIRKNEMEIPTNDDEMNKKWEAFISYSNNANEIITSLWERGVPNYLAYEYLSELKKFVLSKNKITETKDEIIEAVIDSTLKQHKVSEVEEVQSLYQKVRSTDPVKAEELKGVIEFLGDGTDVQKLNEKFNVEGAKFPLLAEFDVANLRKPVEAEEERGATRDRIVYTMHRLFEISRNRDTGGYDVFQNDQKKNSNKILHSVDEAKKFIDTLVMK